jgi:hypothetical protein
MRIILEIYFYEFLGKFEILKLMKNIYNAFRFRDLKIYVSI